MLPALESKDPTTHHAALVGICPELSKADAVSHPSGSHGDVTKIATGSVASRSFGTHCRVAVKDRVFDTDRAFFTANPDRHLYCREFIEGEFPLEVIKLPAGYRPVVVVRLIAKWEHGNQIRDRRPSGCAARSVP